MAEGIWSLPQPLPGPLRYVLVYAVGAGDGVVLVDAGWDREAGLTGLDGSLRQVGASIVDVRGVLVTHAHFDHYALAGAVREASGAWLAIHEREARAIEPPPVARDPNEVSRFFAGFGLDGEELRDAVEVGRRFASGWSRAVPDRLLASGDRIEVGGTVVRVLHTPGHAPGHACYLVEGRGVVFTGDHVLSETTPNVSILPGGGGSPLDDYLSSLEATRRLGRALALPGHERRVAVGRRSSALLAHHRAQLEHTATLVASGATTVSEVAAQMRWSRPWTDLGPVDRVLALGETYAHLVVLERRGAIERVSERPLRYAARPSTPPARG